MNRISATILTAAIISMTFAVSPASAEDTLNGDIGSESAETPIIYPEYDNDDHDHEGPEVLPLAYSTGEIPMENGKPVVYLTFDDGPGPTTTARYLALLAQYDAQATFFVTGGRVQEYPALAQQIVNSGHAIASHTWNHKALATLNTTQITEQFTSTNSIVAETTGVQMSCYRPPYGSTSTNAHNIAVSLGLTNSEWTANYPSGNRGGWDVDTNDYKGNQSVIANALSKISGGEVVLMHDIHSYSYTPLASWMAANADRFVFRALPGCGGTISEPELDITNPASWYRFQIGRLYSAYFDRAPDSSGWEYWNTQYVHSMSLNDMSDFFASSPEFVTRYGDTSDAEFVELVYSNVMGRTSDAEGKAYWLGRLNTGLGRGELMTDFSESPEFKTVAGTQVTGTCWDGNVTNSYACAASIIPGYTE